MSDFNSSELKSVLGSYFSHVFVDGEYRRPGSVKDVFDGEYEWSGSITDVEACASRFPDKTVDYFVDKSVRIWREVETCSVRFPEKQVCSLMSVVGGVIDFWYESLNGVNPEYKRGLLSAVREVADKDSVRAYEFLVDSGRVFRKLKDRKDGFEDLFVKQVGKAGRGLDYEIVRDYGSLLSDLEGRDEVKYLPLVLETADRVFEMAGTPFNMIRTASSVLDKLAGLSEDYVPLVYGAVNKLIEHDEGGFNSSASNLSANLEVVIDNILRYGEEFVPIIFRGVDELAGLDASSAAGLAVDSRYFLSVDAGRWAEMIVDVQVRVAEDCGPWGFRLVKRANSIISRVKDGVGEEYVPVFYDLIAECGDKVGLDKDGIWQPLKLVDDYLSVLKDLERTDESLRDLVLGVVCDASEECGEFTHYLLTNSRELLLEIGREVEESGGLHLNPRDYLLIKSVRNLKDANVVSKLVDSKNPEVEKFYAKRVGEFF